MEEKLRGIVLSGIAFGESDKILNIFTLEKGTVSAKIKGVKKAGAKLKFAAEPFCFAEYIFSTSGDKRTVIGASLIDSFYPVREDIFKFYSAGAVIQFSKSFAKEEMVSENFFFLVVDALKNIAYGEEIPQSYLVKFLLSALSLVGYALNIEGCFTCGKNITGRVFFEYSCGGFFCEDCKGKYAREINLSTLNALKTAKSSVVLSKEQSLFSLKLLDYYITNKTEEKLSALKELIKIIN